MPQRDLQPLSRRKRPFDLSVVLLLAANALPLIGVLFWGWDAARIVFLYWFENVVVGAINVLRIAKARGPSTAVSSASSWLDAEARADVQRVQGASPVFLIPFFIAHYGLFTLVHGVFLFSFFADSGLLPESTPQAGVEVSGLLGQVFSGGGAWAALALIVSHVYSFGANYLAGGEYLRVSTAQAMMAPYGRVVVLHIAILFGGMAVQALGNPIPLLVLLVLGKTALDLGLHWRSHAAVAGPGAA